MESKDCLKPLIFGDDSVTIAFNQSCEFKLYVGQTIINHIESFKINKDNDGNSTKIKIIFKKSSDPSMHLLIEEDIRMVSKFPWITVDQ